MKPVFYYDFSSPYSYLAAERINGVLPEQPLWQPVSMGFILRASGRTPWSMQPGGPDPGDLEEIDRRAAERGLPAVKYPKGWPVESYSLLPLRAAVFAGQTGRMEAFTLAAFRQVFAAGRDLGQIDNVLIAAAACELHPKAVVKGVETESVKLRLTEATNEAIELGVQGLPTVAVGDELFWGDDKLGDAAEAAAAAG